MDIQRPDQIRLFRLASGETLEIETYEPLFDDGGDLELEQCPQCSSRLVHPVDWSEDDGDDWLLTLRCPECEWSETDLYDQPLLDRFDAALNRGTETLLEDLRTLEIANRHHEIDRFAEALANDLILPEDF